MWMAMREGNRIQRLEVEVRLTAMCLSGHERVGLGRVDLICHGPCELELLGCADLLCGWLTTLSEPAGFVRHRGLPGGSPKVEIFFVSSSLLYNLVVFSFDTATSAT